MRCDCTAEPPGELISRATALALRTPKARPSVWAPPARVSPGRSGVEMPITPVSRMMGTTGTSVRHRRGSRGRQAATARAGRSRNKSAMDSSKLWISRHAFVLKLRNLHDLRGGSEAGRGDGRHRNGEVGITNDRQAGAADRNILRDDGTAMARGAFCRREGRARLNGR